MEIVRISDNNKETFSLLLGEDLSEDAMRRFYGGIGTIDDDDSAAGAIVYELLEKESVEDTKSMICFAGAKSREVFDAMIEDYTDHTVSEENITETSYELDEEVWAKVFQEKGFSFEERESDKICLTLGELGSLKQIPTKKCPKHISTLGKLSLLQYKTAVKKALLSGHRGAFEDMAYLPLRWFDTEISACAMSGEKAVGLFLVRRNPSGTLIPAFLYAYGPEYQKDLIRMIGYSLRQALKLYPPETVVMINRKNENTRALTKNLLPGCVGKKIFAGRRKE